MDIAADVIIQYLIKIPSGMKTEYVFIAMKECREIKMKNKQRLESDFRKTMNKKYSSYYFLKLYNHPVTHQSTPSDFLVLNRSNNYLVECKETSDRFSFDRLTQLDDMIKFEDSLPQNYSYALIMFYSGRLDTSQIFMIPCKNLKEFIGNVIKKSLTAKQAELYWEKYKIKVEKGGILNLDEFI